MSVKKIVHAGGFLCLGVVQERVQIVAGGRFAEVEVPRGTLFAKRVVDLAVSLLALVALSPVFLTVSIAICIETRGGVFFRQRRLGKGAREFVIFKFRSMVKNAETLGDGLACYGEDLRVTKVGKFIRISALDELPQFWNVLKGDMSLVGPRPPVHNELGDLVQLPEKALVRFCVKPGITGLAQVAGRNELAWPEKIRFDGEYVRRICEEGIIVDIQIAFKTVWVLLNRKGIYDIKGKDQKIT